MGGLLTSHFLAKNPKFYKGKYNDRLLPILKDLGDRLLKVFDTKTGIPYGTVNLKYGK
jgi:mannosidase alpha-like ER degradation enhancer 2